MDKSISEPLCEKTMKELAQAEHPKSDSRSWGNTEGYRFLLPWSNAVLLRFFIRKFTAALPKSEYRRKSQVDDASRSVVRNIEEGYKRATTGEYIQFISYSQGSLEEVKGDIRELTEDGFLKSKPGSSLIGIKVDLKDFNQSLRGYRGNYGNLKVPLTSFNSPLVSSNFPLNSPKIPLRDFTYKSITVLYSPLSRVSANDLSYEIFTELINKTDWLLRRLVVSLERKQDDYKLQLAGLR